MTKVFIAAVALCAFTAGSAFAQVGRSESTTTIENPATPDESVSKSEKSESYNSDGSETRSSKNVTRSSGGVSAKSKSQTVAPDGSAVTNEHEHDVAPDGSERSSTTTTEER